MSKIIEYILTLWIILTLNFFLPRLMPGDPFLFLSDGNGWQIYAIMRHYPYWH
jgi:peptide/nickel transport system permease protein